MTAHAGQCPAPGNTVRLAEKEAKAGGLDAASVRRAVDAITAMTGCRRSDAREQIRAFAAGGGAVADIDAWLRANFRIDPTGVTAVRNVDRARAGGRDAA